MRQRSYAENLFCCWACGVHKFDALVHQWLEAHEFYKIDYARGRAKMVEVVALCHLCHNFIHSGRLQALVDQGELTEAFQRQVLAHGRTVLRKAKLRRPKEPKIIASWKVWRMEIGGKFYGPTSRDFEAWERGEWKQWQPFARAETS